MRSMLIVALAATLAACGQPQVEPEFGQKVRAYLLANPEVLVEVNTALREKRAREAIAPLRNELERDSRDRVINPGGKVTLVVMFDYNCGYCKVIAPEILELARTHPQVRFVFKDMVIFGPVSEYASAAAALAKTPAQYLALHAAFMAAKPLNDESATRIILANGLDPAAVRREQASDARKKYLTDVHGIANALGLEGTPAFIIGDTVIPGADPEAVKVAIAAALRGKR